MLWALHLLSAGLAPGARAEKPSLALLWMLKPVQTVEANIADDSTGFVHDYLDLVNVRQENAQLIFRRHGFAGSGAFGMMPSTSSSVRSNKLSCASARPM